MGIRVLIVDDHRVVRQGLKMFLALDEDLEVVGEASDGSEAIDMVRQLRPDVVLMDLLMPVMDGIAATAAIHQEFPETEVLALTSVLEDDAVVGAIKAGAIGYLLKDTEGKALCQAIKAAAAGQVQLTRKAAARLMEALHTNRNPEELTEREIEIVRLIAAGQANKDIARVLFIAEKTVRTHVSNILSKLGLQSRTQVALYAIHSGLVFPQTLG